MRILLITAALLPLAACHASWDRDGAKSHNSKAAGPMTTRTYDVAGFNGVDLRGSDDVDVKIGPAFSVKAEGGANVLEDLEISVVNNTLRISRMMVSGVVEAPRGAHFTECPPDYNRDEAFQKEYAASAKEPAAWDAFKAKYIDVSEKDYQKAVAK